MGGSCLFHTIELTDDATPAQQPALALAAHAVVIAIEAVGVSALDGEVGLTNVGAV